MHRIVESDRERALEVGTQGLDLRQQAGLHLTLGEQQLGAELGQARRLALLPQDQRLAEFELPALEFAPHVAVGQVQRARCRRDRTAFGHGLQQVEQRVADQRRRGGGAQSVVEADPMHFCSY